MRQTLGLEALQFYGASKDLIMIEVLVLTLTKKVLLQGKKMRVGIIIKDLRRFSKHIVQAGHEAVMTYMHRTERAT